jgi:hypothetical protein
MGVNYNPKIVTDGLQLYLDAANTKSYPGSGASWYDLSGNNRTATIYGTSRFTSANGGKFEFLTGQTVDYISLPASALQATAANYTIEFWMQPTTSRTGYFHSVSNGANHNYMLMYATAAGTLGHLAGGNTVPFSNNEILQFSMVRNGYNTGNLYKNGSLHTTNVNITVLTAAANGGWILNQEQDALGGGFDANQNFIGSFMGVKVYNRALSSAEIATNFNALRGRYGI